MGLTKFIISVDHPVYYSGQTISGKLVVQIDKPMSMRGVVVYHSFGRTTSRVWFFSDYTGLTITIYIKYSGRGSVHWTETHHRQSQRSRGGSSRSVTESYTATYSNAEQYLALQQLVFGNDVEDNQLAAGEHIFLFNCQLPMNLPSSFEGMYGRIRYSVEATIYRPWKFNHVKKHPITVMSVFDLNCNAFAVTPVVEQTSKTFWGHSKQLFMCVNLPVRGFVPGQIIPIKVFLNNESEVKVKSIYISLKQNVTFHATRKSRAVKMYVFRNEFPVPKGLGCEEVSLNLQLPAVPPSYLEFSKIIDLNYQLNVKAQVKAWYHKDLKTSTEVIVGNIPLMNYQRPIPFQHLHHDPVVQENPSYSQVPDHQPPTYGFVVPPGTMYENLPPPSYEQCMGLERSGKEEPENDPDSDGEAMPFAPLYPVYKFETSQS